MILNFDRGYGQSAEQMVQSLMESTQMALDNLERKLGLSEETLTDGDGNQQDDDGNQQKDVKIEVGTSGIWTYEKWSNGTIKCWTTSHWSTPTLKMTAVGNCYKSNTVNMPFPSDLFVNVNEYFNAQFNFKSAGTYLQSVMYTAVPNNNVLPVVILKGGSSTSSCGFSAIAIGRWKE